MKPINPSGFGRVRDWDTMLDPVQPRLLREVDILIDLMAERYPDAWLVGITIDEAGKVDGVIK